MTITSELIKPNVKVIFETDLNIVCSLQKKGSDAMFFHQFNPPLKIKSFSRFSMSIDKKLDSTVVLTLTHSQDTPREVVRVSTKNIGASF